MVGGGSDIGGIGGIEGCIVGGVGDDDVLVAAFDSWIMVHVRDSDS